MKQIDECYQILKDPYGYVKRFKAESGRRVVGTFCSYAPEEIILAAGAHPFRLFGSGEKIHLAETHLQSYCCSLVRGALEDALAGRLEFLDGVVFPHTCDSIQRHACSLLTLTPPVSRARRGQTAAPRRSLSGSNRAERPFLHGSDEYRCSSDGLP